MNFRTIPPYYPYTDTKMTYSIHISTALSSFLCVTITPQCHALTCALKPPHSYHTQYGVHNKPTTTPYVILTHSNVIHTANALNIKTKKDTSRCRKKNTNKGHKIRRKSINLKTTNRELYLQNQQNITTYKRLGKQNEVYYFVQFT